MHIDPKMHGASVAALTLYEGLRSMDSGAEIAGIVLLKEKGGKSQYDDKLGRPVKTVVIVCSDSIAAGAKEDFSQEQTIYFERLKSMNLKSPFLIGFGISNNSTFAKASRYGAGAIVGSAFINMLRSSTNLESDINTFIQSIK